MVKQSQPENIGILALEIYFPNKFVCQTALEKHDKASDGKYTIGLGQNKLGFCDDREDVCSFALTVVQNLLEKYSISPTDIGRLEVGTESQIDRSKSVKSVIMQLFSESGNTDVEGVDVVNACYGGTAAIFNAISWIESSFWDGRKALVVASDISVYGVGAARPTGGAGAVAILIGPDAPIIFEPGLRASHMNHSFDFYKPDPTSEYPLVDGNQSVKCYLDSLDKCYQRLMQKMLSVHSEADRNLFSYCLFHSPYRKLVRKAYARLAFNDYIRNPTAEEYQCYRDMGPLELETSHLNKELENLSIKITKEEFSDKVESSLLTSTEIGNMYCASLYGCLISLIHSNSSKDLQGRLIMLFSYGSGLASSIFAMRVVENVEYIKEKLGLDQRLSSRNEYDPNLYSSIMQIRELRYVQKSYKPIGEVSSLSPGTFYLKEKDSQQRRVYVRKAP